MISFYKTPYKEKRAMVLWRRGYIKKLEARKKVFEYKYGKLDPENVLFSPLKKDSL